MGGISRVRGVIGRVIGGSECHPWCPFGTKLPFSTPAAHARVAGPEQERVALRAVADSGKPLPLQPIGSACPSTRSGCAVPCGASLHALAWHFARHQAVAKRKQGRILCDGFAQRQGLGWNPSRENCPDLQTLRFAHREGSNLHFVLNTGPFEYFGALPPTFRSSKD